MTITPDISADVLHMAFAAVRGMGVDLAHKMLEVVGSERTFFEMSERDLRGITGSRSKICDDAYRRLLLDEALREHEFVARSGIRLLYYTDPDYPQRLLEAEDAPLMLYTLGTLNLNTTHMVSIVGTRHATPYGQRFCETLLADLAQQLPDVATVSGLAYGIDIAGHRASLRFGVPTAAVLAHGLNRIYPAAHRADATAIVRQGGALVTDYRSTDDIHRNNFLARNRIIAALSDCTLVVESASHGGSLVTAALAQSYNRDVFAVPGRIADEFSRGCNKIIGSNRAMLITCADDLIKAMRWDNDARTPQVKQILEFANLTPDEQKIVDALRHAGTDLHINDLTNAVGLPVYRIMSALVELDSKGHVLTLPGCRYGLAQ